MKPDVSAQIELLPKSLQVVAETFGMPLTLKLVAHFGGTELQLPKYPAPEHPIIKALGNDDGKALCTFLKGEPMYIPHMRKKKTVRREVLELAKQGKSRAEIARILGISQRWVREVANTPPSNQIDLFS